MVPIRMLAFVLPLALLSASAHATTINFTATDIPDVVIGEDLWQYQYAVSDVTFDTDYGFSIVFDYTLYGSLEDSPPYVNPDWDVITLQPDLLLPDYGIYDGLASVDGASLLDSFTVDFVWLGSGDAGAQAFEIYEPGFTTIETGFTTLTSVKPVPEPPPVMPVPEPSSALLFAIGASVCCVALRRRG